MKLLYDIGEKPTKFTDSIGEPVYNTKDKKTYIVDKFGEVHKLTHKETQIYPLGDAWGGTLLTATTTPTLASVEVQGLNVIAYIYPDGSIVGESDYGDFIVHPNGNKECTYIGTLASSASPVW